MALQSNNQPVLCCGCVEKLVGPCRGFFRYFSLGYPVHPIQPTAPHQSEFVNLGPKIRVRVIHVKPSDDSIQNEHFPCFNFNKRLSLSEEYWFTRWNKPLKTGICNCSFRRSLRYSAILDEKSNSNRLSTFDTPPTRITNVHTFVERLVQETLFEAFQEYVMSIKINPKNVKEGVSNTSYEATEDGTDGILLRSIKSKCDNAAVLPADCVTVQNLDKKSRNCNHNVHANKTNVSKRINIII